jgi:hypothetical protein
LRAAAIRAQQLAEAHGWSSSTEMSTIDGVATLLTGHPRGIPVDPMSIRTRLRKPISRLRVSEVLEDLGLLAPNGPTAPAWIDRRTRELPTGFALDICGWLLVLHQGDNRTQPRSLHTAQNYFKTVQPFIEFWARQRDHLREVTRVDIMTTLAPLRGHQRNTAIAALRSLFRYAKKYRLVFTDPTRALRMASLPKNVMPMQDQDIRSIEEHIVSPVQRLAVTLAAVHGARPLAIRHLRLDDLDLPNRQIKIGKHLHRLGDLTIRVLHAWLEHRRATWPMSPNPYLAICERNALNTTPLSDAYLVRNLTHRGIPLDRIRTDAILHEALSTGADQLHLVTVFNLSHRAAAGYVEVAHKLISTVDVPHSVPGA